MKKYVKRMVKSLGSSAPLEFPAAEAMALIIWAISYSIFYSRFHIVIAIMISTIIAIPFFILFKRYIKSNQSKQNEIDIDIIRQFDLNQEKSVEILLSSTSYFDASLCNYAVKTLINLQLLKFYAKLDEDGKTIVVSIQDDKGNIIATRTFYNITNFEQVFSPKQNT